MLALLRNQELWWKCLKTCFIGFGVLIIGLACATHLWDLNLVSSYQWLKDAFGPLFILIFTFLSALGVYSIYKLRSSSLSKKQRPVWYEIGQQAASGIATLALTFTLLGISLGIESLSQQSLNPETISSVIQELTKHFSTAFMTTVVGLPTAHLIRSVLAVHWAAIQQN